MLEVDDLHVWLGKRSADGIFFVEIVWTCCLAGNLNSFLTLEVGEGIDAGVLVSQGGVAFACDAVSRYHMRLVLP